MNGIILIIAGLFEGAFAFCLGKAKTAAGTAVLGMIVFKEPATTWRLLFLATLVASVIDRKAVSH